MERSPGLDLEQNREASRSVRRPNHPDDVTERRPPEVDQDRPRSLRSSEIRAMSDIGKFRIVDEDDLRRFAYRGNGEEMTQDIQSLRSKGLIEERTFYRAHRQLRRIATLTENGQRTLRNSGQVPQGQQLHYGFVKTRDIDHDADLYKVFQKEAEDIQRQGGKVTKIRLDSELNSTMARERFAARKLPKAQKRAWLQAAAEQHGLSIKAGTVSLPDIQIEYETVEGTIAHENLELVSEHYGRDAICSKADAGFKVYVRSGDSNRVRRALNDSGSIDRILSI